MHPTTPASTAESPRFAESPNGYPRLSMFARRATFGCFVVFVMAGLTAATIRSNASVQYQSYVTYAFYIVLAAFALGGLSWILHDRLRPIPTRQEVCAGITEQIAALQDLLARLSEDGVELSAELLALQGADPVTISRAMLDQRTVEVAAIIGPPQPLGPRERSSAEPGVARPRPHRRQALAITS